MITRTLCDEHFVTSQSLVQILIVTLLMDECCMALPNIILKDTYVGEEVRLVRKFAHHGKKTRVHWYKHGMKLDLSVKKYADNYIIRKHGRVLKIKRVMIKDGGAYTYRNSNPGLGIGDQSLRYISQFSALDYLDISGCSITNPGLAYLSELPLRTLSINNCETVNDTGLYHLSKIKTLNTLCMEGCNDISDSGLYHVSQLKCLMQLDISWCHRITDDGIKHLSDLPLLRWLRLEECDGITDDVLLNMSKFKVIIRDL